MSSTFCYVPVSEAVFEAINIIIIRYLKGFTSIWSAPQKCAATFKPPSGSGSGEQIGSLPRLAARQCNQQRKTARIHYPAVAQRNDRHGDSTRNTSSDQNCTESNSLNGMVIYCSPSKYRAMQNRWLAPLLRCWMGQFTQESVEKSQKMRHEKRKRTSLCMTDPVDHTRWECKRWFCQTHRHTDSYKNASDNVIFIRRTVAFAKLPGHRRLLKVTEHPRFLARLRDALPSRPFSCNNK